MEPYVRAPLPRKNFNQIAIPVQVIGIGGPGAPHDFTFERRENVELQPGESIANTLWGFAPHPQDVILRTSRRCLFDVAFCRRKEFKFASS